MTTAITPIYKIPALNGRELNALMSDPAFFDGPVTSRKLLVCLRWASRDLHPAVTAWACEAFDCDDVHDTDAALIAWADDNDLDQDTLSAAIDSLDAYHLKACQAAIIAAACSYDLKRVKMRDLYAVIDRLADRMNRNAAIFECDVFEAFCDLRDRAA